MGAALAGAASLAMAQSFVVSPELWDRPRTGQVVLEQTAIREAVKAYLGRRGSRLVVHHGPTQESLLLAEELRAWLVALALDPSRVTLQNDLKLTEPLRIEIRENGQ
ncbi:MAG: hypothetical protein JSU71_05190 [Betaproteobacteria bacterium]|nr:MAG: hypothetical protein JSU71_05190 [Betaproteobacteria bacterium]